MGSCRAGGSSCTSSTTVSRVLKSLVRALAIAGVVLILMAGMRGSQGGRSETERLTVGPTRKVKATAGAEKIDTRDPALGRINDVSKRRVPNGPDPIHNRRAGKSGKPPGQA